MDKRFQITSVREICICIFKTRPDMTEEQLAQRMEMFKCQIPKRIVKGKKVNLELLPQELELIDKIYQYVKENNLREKFLSKEMDFDTLVSSIENWISEPEKNTETAKETTNDIHDNRVQSGVLFESEAEKVTDEQDLAQSEKKDGTNPFWDKEKSKASQDRFINSINDIYNADAVQEEKSVFTANNPDLLLCGEPQLVRYHRDDFKGGNILYHLEGMQYTIQEIGGLCYKTTPTIENTITEYEITIKRDEQEPIKLRRFGEIIIPQMTRETENGDLKITDYGRAVLAKLLGKENLESIEQRSYIGRIRQEYNTEMQNLEYKIEHSDEEYTAVSKWKDLERKGEKPIYLPPKQKGENLKGGKNSEGEGR